MSPAKRTKCLACERLGRRCALCELRAQDQERAELRKGIKSALRHLKAGRKDGAALALFAALEVADEVAHD